MKLILLEDVENLGDAGEVVTVKPGYGRNFLIPNGLARLATPGSIKNWEETRRQQALKLAQKKGDAEKLAEHIENMEIVLAVKTGEENRIFGTVTSQQLAVELAQRGIDIDRRKISIDEDIRVVGVYTATVKLHPEVSAKLKLRVMPESGPVEA